MSSSTESFDSDDTCILPSGLKRKEILIHDVSSSEDESITVRKTHEERNKEIISTENNQVDQNRSSIINKKSDKSKCSYFFAIYVSNCISNEMSFQLCCKGYNVDRTDFPTCQDIIDKSITNGTLGNSELSNIMKENFSKILKYEQEEGVIESTTNDKRNEALKRSIYRLSLDDLVKLNEEALQNKLLDSTVEKLRNEMKIFMFGNSSLYNQEDVPIESHIRRLFVNKNQKQSLIKFISNEIQRRNGKF
ncbi:hypothetical protein WA158_006950 [Blastocystis sp. Blastoise]